MKTTLLASMMAMILTGCSVIYDTDGYTFTEEDTGSAEALCQNYCTTVSEACDGSHEQYATTQGCLDTCRALPEGTMADESGNTVGCRMHYALEAVENPELCLAAGPGGNGVCGSNCEGFCQIHDQVCVDSLARFDNITDCITHCSDWDDTVPYSADTPNDDTLACRLAHGTLAASNPETHCSHMADDSPICL